MYETCVAMPDDGRQKRIWAELSPVGNESEYLVLTCMMVEVK